MIRNFRCSVSLFSLILKDSGLTQDSNKDIKFEDDVKEIGHPANTSIHHVSQNMCTSYFDSTISSTYDSKDQKSYFILTGKVPQKSNFTLNKLKIDSDISTISQKQRKAQKSSLSTEKRQKTFYTEAIPSKMHFPKKAYINDPSECFVKVSKLQWLGTCIKSA